MDRLPDSEKHLRLIGAAYHEAGHAVAAYKLSVYVEKVVINLIGRGGNAVHSRSQTFGKRQDKNDLARARALCIVYMAGPLSQEANSSVAAILGAMDDTYNVATIANLIHSNPGVESLNWVLTVYKDARRLVDKERFAIKLVADTLIAKGELSGVELAELLRPMIKSVNISAIGPLYLP